MAQGEGEYRVGRGKPPLHTRFQKGRSGNPSGPRRKADLPALLAAALDKEITVGGRRVSKREAIVAALVERATGAELSATKLLIAMLKDIERKAAPAAPGTADRTADETAEALPLGRADAAIVAGLAARLRRMIVAEIAAAAAPAGPDPVAEPAR